MTVMISKEEVQNLAELARLELTDTEVPTLQKDISAILDYIGQVSAVSSDIKETKPLLRNMMREDVVRGSDVLSNKREQLLAALPKREDDYAVVRKIIEK